LKYLVELNVSWKITTCITATHSVCFSSLQRITILRRTSGLSSIMHGV